MPPWLASPPTPTQAPAAAPAPRRAASLRNRLVEWASGMSRAALLGTVAMLTLCTMLAGIVVLHAAGATHAALRAATNRADPSRLVAARFPIDQVISRVEQLRGLEFETSPTIEILPVAEMVERLSEVAASAGVPGRGDTARRNARAREAILKMTGTVPAEIDIAALGSVPHGAYDPRSDTIYLPLELMSSQSAAVSESVLAHELLHALEDQAQGLPKPAQGPTSPEAAEVSRALTEGSATFIEDLYSRKHLGLELTLPDLAAQRLALDEPFEAAISKGTLFRYVSGARFVASLYERRGWSLVNKAMRTPPTSMEQVLHPELWPRSEGFARPTVLAPPHKGNWRSLGTSPVSETDTDILISTAFGPDSAAKAADGWGGGRLAMWRSTDAPGSCPEPCRSHTVLAIVWRWDSFADTRQFLRFAGGYLNLALDGEPVNRRLWKLDGGYAGLAGSQANTTALVFAPRPVLSEVLAVRATIVAGSLPGRVHP